MKDKMRNLKEVKALLASVYCLNEVKQNDRDENIRLICEYAFRRIFNSTGRIFTLCCIGKTETQILEEIKNLIYKETAYKQLMGETGELK